MIIRDNISADIKREVRQRCGFGCVICGNPIYDYEHMEEWAIVRRHIANEITLLCPFHHREKTAGRMPIAMVRKANDSPHNLKKGISGKHELYFYGSSAKVKMSSCEFLVEDRGKGGFMIPLLIDNIPVITVRLKDNEVFLNFVLFDRKGAPVLIIKDNILSFSIGVWDITFEGRILTLREKLYKISLEIEFQTPDVFFIRKASLYYNSNTLTINNKGVKIGNKERVLTTFHRIAISGFYVGIQIGLNEIGCASAFRF